MIAKEQTMRAYHATSNDGVSTRQTTEFRANKSFWQIKHTWGERGRVGCIQHGAPNLMRPVD